MLQFLMNNIEQADLALEHIAKGDAVNARFGLMLLDNVVEITLHQIAKDEHSKAKSWLYRDKPYDHSGHLRKALGRPFEPKLQLAKAIGILSGEMSDTIGIFHEFRNEVYHIGVQHEAVLPAIARFYVRVACGFLESYSPSWIAYSPGMPIPERARKYFDEKRHFTDGAKQYQDACSVLAGAIEISADALAESLADHMDQVIEDQDTAIDTIATGGPRQTSRDEAVAETMAWKIAFSDEGKAFARDNKWPGGSVLDYVKWIEANHPLKIKFDPVPGWRRRSDAVREENNPHKALKKYRDFMTQTAEARELLEEAHAQVEQYIDGQIERARAAAALRRSSDNKGADSV